MTAFRIKLMFAMIMAEILATIEITMIFAALRHMVEDFGTTPDAVGWTITAFLLAAAASAAIVGRLGDIYDRKVMLLVVIAVAIIGAFIAGSSTTLSGVVFGRTLQGITGAALPLCIGILRQNIDSRSLPIYVGALTGILTVTAGLGLLLGGVIVDYLTWNWIFYIIGMVGIAAWFAVYWLLPSTRPGKAEPGTNFVGGVLFAPGIVLLILMLNQGRHWGWLSWQSLSLAILGSALLVLWARSELRAKVPLLNIRLLLSREICLAYIATVLFALTWNQFGQVWSMLLQQPTETGAGLGMSASRAGLLMQPQTLMALVGGPLAGWCLIRYGSRFSIAVGALVMAVSWTVAMIKHDTIPVIIVLMLGMGISSAFLFALFNTIVARAAPPDRTSEAVGVLQVLRTTANSVGAALVFYLMSQSTVPGPGGRGQFPDAFSYTLTMGYIAAGSFLIFLLYLFFYNPRVDRELIAEKPDGT